MLPVFGPGALFVERTDVANQTPVNIGKVNEFSIDFAFQGKDLFGENQFALMHARGTGKVTAKAKTALISAIAFNSVFFGMSLAAGADVIAKSESHTIPVSPFKVTVAPPSSGTFVADVGVIHGSGPFAGLPLILTTGTPSTGEYAVNTGTGAYTFAAADTTDTVLITYAYNRAGLGQHMTILNNAIGDTPTFKAWYYTAVNQPGGAVPLTIEMYSCTSDKLSMQFKLEDFTYPEFDMALFDNGAGQLGQINYGEVS